LDAEVRIAIATETDIVLARQEGRRLASGLPFSVSDLTVLATAISEIARNIIGYAGRGQMVIRLTERNGRSGVEVDATDEGPGIPDVRLALQDGYSTSGSLGLGLPGARRLMDEFEVRSENGRGTHVTMRLWTR
jgi:serine/threonine-protein kinase RsbT